MQRIQFHSKHNDWTILFKFNSFRINALLHFLSLGGISSQSETPFIATLSDVNAVLQEYRLWDAIPPGSQWYLVEQLDYSLNQKLPCIFSCLNLFIVNSSKHNRNKH